MNPQRHFSLALLCFLFAMADAGAALCLAPPALLFFAIGATGFFVGGLAHLILGFQAEARAEKAHAARRAQVKDLRP